MQYELYVDSLLLVNFVMNLYVLLLAGRSGLNIPETRRVVMGAAYGAFSYFLPFFIPGPFWFRIIVGIAAGSTGMILIAFKVKSLRYFFQILEKLLFYSFFLGGLLLFVIRRVPAFRKGFLNIFGIMGMGGAGFLFLLRFRRNRKMPEHCMATLIRGTEKRTVAALVDSGNSLIEPVSGKPVSIIGKELFLSLWKEETPGFRAIPYHSIGKKRGILQGYLLPQLCLLVGSEEKICRDVYVAVSEELCGEKILSEEEPSEKPLKNTSEKPSGETETIKMILHPALLRG